MKTLTDHADKSWISKYAALERRLLNRAKLNWALVCIAAGWLLHYLTRGF